MNIKKEILAAAFLLFWGGDVAISQEIPISIGRHARVISYEEALSRSVPASAVDHALRIAEVDLDIESLLRKGTNKKQEFDTESEDWRFLEVGNSASITLFPGETLWLEGVRIEDTETTSSWIADVTYPEPGIAVITKTESGIYGSFDVGFRRYAMTSLNGRQAYAKEIESNTKGVCLTGDLQLDEGFFPYPDVVDWHRIKGTKNSKNLDIIFLYTSAVNSYYSNPELIINNMIASLNTAFASSGVNGSARAVYYGLQPGVVDPHGVNDFTTLKNKMVISQSPFGGLASLRNQHKADIVVLLVHRNNPTGAWPICGIAGGLDGKPLYQPDFSSSNSDQKAFVVVAADCADNDRTFHHEIGHIIGAWHDYVFEEWNHAGGPANACGIGNGSCGYTNVSSGFRTIMGSNSSDGFSCSVRGCPRLLRFSDWEQTAFINGSWLPLGQPQGSRYGHENVVATFNGENGRTATIPWVAAYRTPSGPTPSQPALISVDSCYHTHYIDWSDSGGTVGWYEAMTRPISSNQWANTYRGQKSQITYLSSSAFYFQVRSCNSSGCSPWKQSGKITSGMCP